jgi:transcriptional regulator with XRE-family HTH domain
VTPGQLIRSARSRHGLTQAELALRAGSTQASISRLERDELSPSVETLRRLLLVMGEELGLAAHPIDTGLDERHLTDTVALPLDRRLEQAIGWNTFAAELASTPLEPARPRGARG